MERPWYCPSMPKRLAVIAVGAAVYFGSDALHDMTRLSASSPEEDVFVPPSCEGFSMLRHPVYCADRAVREYLR